MKYLYIFLQLNQVFVCLLVEKNIKCLYLCVFIFYLVIEKYWRENGPEHGSYYIQIQY